MNLEAPHLHLMVNHLPVLGTPFALVLGAVGLLRRQDVLVRAALVTLLVVAGASWAAARTGDEAEDIVEELPGVSEERIHRHEEAAEWAARGGEALGLVALVLLWTGRRRGPSRAGVAILLLLAAGLAGWLAYTANLGGEIRHPEIRAGGTADGLDEAAAGEDEESGRGRGRGRGGDDS